MGGRWKPCTVERFMQVKEQYIEDLHDDEEWKTHPDYDGYIFSNYGKCVSLKRMKPATRTPVEDTCGYLQVVIWLGSDDNRKCISMHRVTAELFVDKPEGYDSSWEVDHIDNCKTNNVWTNLQFLSKAANIRKNHAKGYSTKQLKIYDETDDVFYNSRYQCAKALNCSDSNVSHALQSGHLCKGHKLTIVK